MQEDDPKLRKEASLLFSLKKKNAYTVPDGFFSELEKDILRKYPQKKKGVLRRVKRWMQISAAAAIIGLMVLSGIKMLVNKSYIPVETDRTMYNMLDGDRDGETIN